MHGLPTASRTGGRCDAGARWPPWTGTGRRIGLFHARMKKPAGGSRQWMRIGIPARSPAHDVRGQAHIDPAKLGIACLGQAVMKCSPAHRRLHCLPRAARRRLFMQALGPSAATPTDRDWPILAAKVPPPGARALTLGPLSSTTTGSQSLFYESLFNHPSTAQSGLATLRFTGCGQVRRPSLFPGAEPEMPCPKSRRAHAQIVSAVDVYEMWVGILPQSSRGNR